EVDGKAFLVAIDREVICALALDEVRRDCARHLTAGRLDLDDARAKITENLRCVRTGKELGEIEHQKPRQRAVGTRDCHDVSTCTTQAPQRSPEMPPPVQCASAKCRRSRRSKSARREKTRRLLS